ncbi:putative bifunctional UDP-N-acetylglucosamine transferase and deubiquitinase ALG13 [Manduca sexta]|uniref:putative bifunctional UDP-N-acetylglucosamine transferase and deubiquitinase ALG13 n=1 Tax=Manduca sexta TaxID=7130 RepID=UPI00188FD956|nr:putative bifunctional UDP-N-acetylglucosamine transferase and deubiquitinase ALG13 [Manduca sexta]
MSPSPIRCRTPWKIHKRASEPDRWLDELGYFRKHTARDASCLFRAVSENVYNTQRYFHKVRLECVQFMASRRHLFEGSLICPFENYLKEMSNPSESGGLVEISAMSHLYRRDFVIFEANKGPQTKICNGYGDTIYLFYSSDTKHFDVVYTKEFINASSFCQSVVYEILYDGVYQLKDLPYAVDKMLHDKVPSNHIDYFMSDNVERRKKQKERAKIYIETSNDDKDKNNNAVALKCKHHTNDLERASLLKESLSIFVFNRSLIQLENVCLNCLNVNSAKDLLDNGITPFPYKVAKALDPDIYRNIEFDVWSELRREMRYGARYSDGTTLQVGVKCLCKLQQDQSVPYHCHIQEMGPDGGPCLVFIEELGEKRVVNYDQLEPLPLDEIRPWAPPYRYSRTNSQLMTLSQMLQQIGNMTRKQNAGKARKSKPSDENKIDNARQGKPSWGDADDTPYIKHNAYNMDFNFEPMPVEVQALPLMVDCRAGAGAPAHELAHVGHAPPNGAPPPDGHHTQQAGGSGDMGGHNMNQPTSGRASTPATTNAITPYTGGMNPSGGGSGGGGGGGGSGGPGPGPVAVGGGAVGMPAYSMSGACGPYVCGVKSVVWCAPASPPPGAHGPPPAPHLPPPPPPPPHGVNPHVYKSVQPNGADLPMNDIPTLRYYFNLGVECMWAAYGPPPPHPPPRHYSPRDLAQDMQQMSMHDRGGMNHNSGEQNHKHKPQQGNDKPNMNNQNKNNGQRPLLGPRFKRGGNDGNQNNNHQNKGYNNNAGNKGPNNRRNSHVEGRGPAPGYEGECVVEQPLLTLPYLPYPPAPAPPVYPIQYYPLDPDPGMMGMMGGMGYMSYDEGVEYGGVSAYYPAPYPPLPPPHHPHHMEHK